MWKFVLHRIAVAVPIAFLISVFIFALVHLIPGDAAQVIAGDIASDELVDRIRTDLGLDRPLAEQYSDWLRDAVRGDLGTSVFAPVPVTDAIMSRLPTTLSLAALALVVAILIGVPAGLISAVRPGGVLDRFATAGSALGLAVPNFWVGLVLVIVFALTLGWLPATGYVGLTEDPLGWARSMAMPAVALGTSASAVLARQTRNALVGVLERDHIRAARAFGLSPVSVVGKHALKNAAIPVVTVLGLQLTALLGGALVVEKVFALPGLGSLAVTAVNRRDIPMIQGIVVFTTIVVLVVNLLVDIAYALLDPKVRPS